jgi:hypothetical protein
MKLRFLLTLLFLCTLSYAQKKPREEAILPECKNMEYPATCSNKKIAEGLEKLLTKEIASDQIKENRKYFTLSLIFIVDTDGKVIPSETRATCEVTLIRDAALAYVTALPVFIPKDENQEKRRDLFFNTITFVLNDDNSGYHTARPEEYKDKQIIQQKLEPDTYPVFPGCEDINDKDSRCISRNLNKYVIERYQIPKSFTSGQVKMLVTFMVDEKGIISVMKVDGGPYDFQDEAKRVFSKLPKVKPASIRGIPFRTSFSLPITLNI